jgi:hypothetical protein
MNPVKLLLAALLGMRIRMANANTFGECQCASVKSRGIHLLNSLRIRLLGRDGVCCLRQSKEHRSDPSRTHWQLLTPVCVWWWW